MKNFDNIIKAKVIYYPYEGYWFVDENNGSHDHEFENEEIVRYEDYKKLLEDYKELQYRIESLEK